MVITIRDKLLFIINKYYAPGDKKNGKIVVAVKEVFDILYTHHICNNNNNTNNNRNTTIKTVAAATNHVHTGQDLRSEFTQSRTVANNKSIIRKITITITITIMAAAASAAATTRHIHTHK